MNRQIDQKESPPSSDVHDPLHVVVCSDTHYGIAKLRPFFWSLRKAHPAEDLRLHYLMVDGDDAYRQPIAAYCREIGLPCVFYEIGEPVKKAFAGGLHSTSRLTLAAYGRLLMADVLPPEITVAVYLDFDIICQGNLRELVAAAGDCETVSAVRDLGKPEHIFNSGVLVVPVASWRRDGTTVKLIGAFAHMQPRGLLYPMHDQPVLNAVFAGQWNALPVAWNALAVCGSKMVPVEIWNSPELAQPRLFHFGGGVKPWASPGCFACFARPAAIAWGRAQAASAPRVSERIRHALLLALYRALTGERTGLLVGGLRYRMLHRLAEVLFGRESPLCVFRFAWGAVCRTFNRSKQG